LTPGLADKLLDPNNLVAVVTVGIMYMLWTWVNKRFELEKQEQDEIIERLDDYHDELLKLQGELDALRKQINRD
jgi:hypothetical protein